MPVPDTSLDTFYAALAAQAGTTPAALRPADEPRALGHFNLFDVADVLRYPPPSAPAPPVTFDRRSYYKISLLEGRGRAAYDNQELAIETYSLWFAPPQLSVQWWPWLKVWSKSRICQMVTLAEVPKSRLQAVSGILIG